jgi:hypothetical protein
MRMKGLPIGLDVDNTRQAVPDNSMQALQGLLLLDSDPQHPRRPHGRKRPGAGELDLEALTRGEGIRQRLIDTFQIAALPITQKRQQ